VPIAIPTSAFFRAGAEGPEKSETRRRRRRRRNEDQRRKKTGREGEGK
jgi:hypothetical protein